MFVFGSGGTLTVTLDGKNVLGAGYKGNGSLTISEGVTVSSSNGYLGYSSGATGTATVTGANSSWYSDSGLYVGNSGSGMLRIEAGGQVGSQGYLGYSSGSTGTATITGANSKWTNSNLYVGNSGSGTLCIEVGGQVINYSGGYLGYSSGSMGTATITGTNSKWTNRDLYVGNSGSGTLRIEAGGQVSSHNGYLGYSSGSTGTATITGANSKWTNVTLCVGYYGTGNLHIRDGGVVIASMVNVYNSSLLTIDAGYGSILQIGIGGYVDNSGKIRVLTGPQPAAGSQYSPISGTWAGRRTYQSLGGTWDATSYVFTVSQKVDGVSGTPVRVDLAQQQRVSVVEARRNWSVGASFLAKTGTGNSFDFTATAISDTDLTALSGLVDPGQSVLCGWNLTAAGSGYNASDPVYVSLGIPLSLSHGNVQLWRLSGGSWSRFNVDDLTVNDGYASFTSTGLGKYAVSTVPEPGMAVLLVCGLMGAVGWRWRKR